jgi:hypothetical protein
VLQHQHLSKHSSSSSGSSSAAAVLHMLRWPATTCCRPETTDWHLMMCPAKKLHTHGMLVPPHNLLLFVGTSDYAAVAATAAGITAC